MSLYKVGEIWYLYLVHEGRRIRRSTGSSVRKEAQRIHDELRAELWSRKPTSPNARTFQDAVAIWLETGDKGLPDRYRLNALRIEQRALASIDEDALAEVLKPYRGSTRNRMINLLHAVLNCAVQRGWITRVPVMAKVKVSDARIRWLSENEWNRLQQELPPHLLSMARFAIATGLREGNVIGLEWSQVDLQRRVAWIHADQVKTGKPIGIPLSDAAMQVLNAIDTQYEGEKKRPSRVFVYAGKPVTKTSTRAWWKALERAGLGEYEGKNQKFVPNFRWHDLRHTWASWHVMNGTPLEVVQKLGGWKTLQMVMRYAHLAPEHLAAYAGNAQPLRHKSTPQLQQKAHG